MCSYRFNYRRVRRASVCERTCRLTNGGIRPRDAPTSKPRLQSHDHDFESLPRSNHAADADLDSWLLFRQSLRPQCAVVFGEHRERLLAIKRGEVPFEEVEAWRLDLHRQFDAAAEATKLPERPDYEKANALLLKARRKAAG